jgi:Flp pilus assembly pilin Flp
VLTYLTATFAYVRARLGELHPREQGVTAVEYALMIAVIGMLLVGAFYVLYDAIHSKYTIVGDCVQDGAYPSDCSAPPGP